MGMNETYIYTEMIHMRQPHELGLFKDRVLVNVGNNALKELIVCIDGSLELPARNTTSYCVSAV